MLFTPDPWYNSFLGVGDSDCRPERILRCHSADEARDVESSEITTSEVLKVCVHPHFRFIS